MDLIPKTVDALADRYDGRIRAFLRRVTTLGPADMEDAVQEVYLKFHKDGLLDRYNGRAAFTSYLYMVCQSVARNRHRALSRRPTVSLPDNFVLPMAPSQYWTVLVQEIREHLQASPELVGLLERLEGTGSLTRREMARLAAGVRPMLDISC